MGKPPNEMGNCPFASPLVTPLPPVISSLTAEQTKSQSSLCSIYATRRGPHQRIIAISLFGPKENKMFQFNKTLDFLNELMKDLDLVYSDGFILRVYHDKTIDVKDIICPIECEHANVDFCSMDHKLYMPPKIWRFIPAGDPLVDISKLEVCIFVSFGSYSYEVKGKIKIFNRLHTSSRMFRTMRC
jgi:hypothetical protein